MLHHEALEHYLMNKYNYGYREAHGIVEKKYNYNEAIKELEKIVYKERVYDNVNYEISS